MCYREEVPPLSFESFHVACLAGDNGHGKSALLDAMTWALWGKSRASSDDDLVNQGKTDMEVEFEFAIGQQRYRVIRKHVKAGPKRSVAQAMELQIAGPEGFKPLTGASNRETQQKLTGLLRMDYDTFINSSFLIQGRANEFSREPPAQRKEILARILGLPHYDDLGEQARETMKTRGQEADNLERSLTDIDAELAREEGYHKELEEAQTRTHSLEAEASAREAELGSLRSEKANLESKGTPLREAESRVREMTREMDRWRAQSAEHERKIADYETLLKGRGAVEKGYTGLLAARQALEGWNEKLQESSRLKDQLGNLHRVIEQARSELDKKVEVGRQWVQQKESLVSQLPQLKQELTQAQEQLEEAAAAEADLARKREKGQELLLRRRTLQSESAQLEKERKSNREKLDLLSVEKEARCPLCESNLGADGIARLENKYRDELLAKDAAFQSAQADMQRIAAEYTLVENEVRPLEARILKEKAARQQKVTLLEREIQVGQQAEAEMAGWKKKLAELERSLDKKDFAPSETQAARDMEKQLGKLGYDEEKHRSAHQQVQELKQYEPARLALDEADKLLPQEKKSLEVALAEIAARQSQMEADNQRMLTLSQEMAQLPGIRQRLEQANAVYQDLSGRLSEARRQTGAIEERLRRCAELAASKREKEKQLKEFREEESVYRDLSEAFGKKGLQAMLIERAIPEIEDEANRLLGRMTDNRMTLRLDTQRSTKGGKGVVETLDIKVGDELGTRNYEMFSGGETFRIDLALRIALSRLLARRAGAPLRTLVIDEGFGTQDAGGRERLVDAINSIQEDFDKIIVITHIEELRDQFPVRIDVVKTENGSTITVN